MIIMFIIIVYITIIIIIIDIVMVILTMTATTTIIVVTKNNNASIANRNQGSASEACFKEFDKLPETFSGISPKKVWGVHPRKCLWGCSP